MNKYFWNTRANTKVSYNRLTISWIKNATRKLLIFLRFPMFVYPNFNTILNYSYVYTLHIKWFVPLTIRRCLRCWIILYEAFELGSIHECTGRHKSWHKTNSSCQSGRRRRYSHTCTHTYIHMYIRKERCKFVFTHIQVHMYMYFLIHMYMYLFLRHFRLNVCMYIYANTIFNRHQ